MSIELKRNGDPNNTKLKIYSKYKFGLVKAIISYSRLKIRRKKALNIGIKAFWDINTNAYTLKYLN